MAALISTICFIASLGAPVPAIQDIACVSSHTIDLVYHAAPDGGLVTQVDLWSTLDGGATWQKSASERPAVSLTKSKTAPKPQAISFEAPEEGLYGFYLVLYNAAGASSDPPIAGTVPQQFIRIDETAPVVKLLQARADPRFEINREIDIRWEVEDAGLPDRPVAIHYRTAATKTFQLLASSQPAAGRFRWIVPNDTGERIEIKVSATDLAGLTGRGIDHDFRLPKSITPTAVASGDLPNNEEAESIEPAVDAESKNNAAALENEPDAASPALPPPSKEARALYTKATWHRSRGELDLAVARYLECLEISPQYSAARHDLAGVLLLQGQMEAAERELNQILKDDPTHVPAQKTLALVLSKRGDYRSARETLHKVLLLAPNDAEAWLHAGDVAMFMGDRPAAQDAWTRVSQLELADDRVKKRAQTRLDLYRNDQTVAEGPAEP